MDILLFVDVMTVLVVGMLVFSLVTPSGSRRVRGQ